MDFFEFTNMNSDFQWRCVVIFLAGGQKCSSPKMFGIKEQWNNHTTALYPWYLSTQSSPKRLHMSTKTKCCWLPGAQQRRCSAEKVICLICCFKLSLTQNLPLQEPEGWKSLHETSQEDVMLSGLILNPAVYGGVRTNSLKVGRVLTFPSVMICQIIPELSDKLRITSLLD